MNEQLQAIRQRRDAVTPWVANTQVRKATAYNTANAAFIAAAPADIDTLLAMVDALTGERDAWRNRCNASDEEMNDVLHRMQAVTAERDALREQLEQAQRELAQTTDERDEEWATRALGL